MKLHEFLKQFEELDPEMEIFQEAGTLLIKPYSNIKFSYIHSDSGDNRFQSINKTQFYDKKVIVLY